MKTPREILLERHRSAEAKLDAIRQKVVDEIVEGSGQQGGARVPLAKVLATVSVAVKHIGKRDACPTFASGTLAPRMSAATLREFLLSVRWHLAGMSAAWAVIALLNMDHSQTPEQIPGKHSTASPRQILTALRENRRQLLELIGPPITESAPAPRTLVPQRRGEIQSEHVMV